MRVRPGRSPGPRAPARLAGLPAGADTAPVPHRRPFSRTISATPDVQAPMSEPTEIRRLTYADLPQVIAIERRAFSTPWSLAMFVLELSKPSGICLAAARGGRLVGYLVCSRYDMVWHLMNVAVDDRLRREGIATALIERLSPWPTRRASSTRWRCARPTPAIRLYERLRLPGAGRRRGYYHDNREDAVIMWRTAEAAANGSDAPAAAAPRARDPGARDELRRHLRRGGHPDGEIASNVIASQGLLHARYGGVVPEVASRRHLELVDAVTADALESAGMTLDDIEWVAVTRGPGLIGALLVGVLVGEGAGGGARAPADAGGPSARPRGGQHPWRPSRSRRPICAWWPAAGTPSWPGWTIRAPTRCWARPSMTPPARRSTRAPACWAWATPVAPSSTAWRSEGDPEAFDFPRSAPGDGSTSASAALKTALLYAVRDLGEEEAEAPPRRPGRLLPARHRDCTGGPGEPRRWAASASAAWLSAAAWPPTRELRASADGARGRPGGGGCGSPPRSCAPTTRR